MTVYYDEQQMCSVLDELENKLPMKYRSIVVSRHPMNHACAVEIGTGKGDQADPETAGDYGAVFVRIGGAVEARDTTTIGMFAYAVAHALDENRILLLPLRAYALDKAMGAVVKVVAAVSASIAERFELQRPRLLGIYNVEHNGPILPALVVGGDGVVQPIVIPVVDQAEADRRIVLAVNTHAMLTIAMGWTLAKGPGARTVGQA
jgi:hypothetical protein